jgi:hypothetical protein
MRSMIGVESCIAVPSGAMTSGISGSLAWRSNSAWFCTVRTTHSCGMPL